jgi:DNA-binding CsgD family transcriptional regulator
MEILRLTPSEFQVFELIHYPNKEIAKRLYISIRTVENHIANMLSKNYVRNKTALRLLDINGVDVEVIDNTGSPKFTIEDREKIKELKKTMSALAIAQRYDCAEGTIWNALKNPPRKTRWINC